MRWGKGRGTGSSSSWIAHGDRVGERRVCWCDLLGRAV